MIRKKGKEMFSFTLPCGDPLVLTTFLILLSLVFGSAYDEIMIGRGIIKVHDSKEYVDYFSYTNTDICVKNASRPYQWCTKKNAEAWTSKPPNFSQCTCRCKYNYLTFFDDKLKCVGVQDLKNHQQFKNGKYILDLPINLETNGSRDLCSCDGCQIDSVMYYSNKEWKAMSKSEWKIYNHGRLEWHPIESKEPKGKILKIQFKNCEHQSNNCRWKSANPKIFLKSRGNYSIQVHLPTTHSLLPVPSTLVPTPLLTKSRVFSTSELETTITNSKFSLHVPTTSFMVSQIICSKTICQSSLSVIGPIRGTQNPISKGQLVDEAPSSAGAIVGSVFACIVVVGIIVFIIVWRRCKQRSRPHTSSKIAKLPPNSTGNPLYGGNKGEEITLPEKRNEVVKHAAGDEEYDYATVDSDGRDQKTSRQIYQSLVGENLRDSVYTPLSKALDSTPDDYSYNHLQHPQYNPPHSKSDPLYNTLEPPNNDEYMEPETQISDNQPGRPEPVYNVLEGPDASPAPQDNDPVYNVLEGPDTNPVPQDNDPVYNVLEDPNANQYPQDNDPVYNVLEGPDDDYDNAPSEDDENLPASGQDNVAYSSTIDLRKAQSPSSPDYDVLEGPEGALQDSVYQPLGVQAQDDVYQPLDRTSQPIYQSLEPNDSMA